MSSPELQKSPGAGESAAERAGRGIRPDPDPAERDHAPDEKAQPTALIGQLRTSQIQVEALRMRGRQPDSERAAGSARPARQRRAVRPSLGETLVRALPPSRPQRTLIRLSPVSVAGAVVMVLALAATLLVFLI